MKHKHFTHIVKCPRSAPHQCWAFWRGPGWPPSQLAHIGRCPSGRWGTCHWPGSPWGREEAEVVYLKFNTFLITARPHLRSFTLNYSLHLMTTKQLCLTNVGIWTGAPLTYFSLQLLHSWMLYLCNCELHRFLKCKVAAHVFTFSKYFSHPVFHNLMVLFWFLCHRGFCLPFMPGHCHFGSVISAVVLAKLANSTVNYT